MDKKISFVLPIYNVEAYLPECVDSILSQKGHEVCEVILVDDGSPDRCGGICDRYAQENDNVQVIHKPNGGLSSARNAGLDIAQGEYILFVDSDDYIEPGSLEKILAWIETTQADIGFLYSKKVFPDGSSEPLGENLSRDRIYGKSREEVLRYLAGCPKFPASAWGKIYRRGFLQERGIRFPADRRLSEDLQFSLDLLMAAKNFDYLDFPYYCYRQNRKGSITNTINARYYFDTFLFVQEGAERLTQDQQAVDPIAALAMSFVAYEYAIRLWERVFLTGEDGQKADRLLKEYRWVLRYGRSRRTKLVALAVGMLGLDRTAKLLDWYMNRK